MTDKANPLALYHQRQIENQAQPVTPFGPDGGPAQFQLSGSNAGDLAPVIAVAEPTFEPYAYPFLTTDGTLEVVMASGQVRSFPPGTFPLGVILPLRVTQVLSGTTATLLAATPA